MLILKSEKESNLRERCLKAFLDLVILRLLADQSMTGYEINQLLVKKFGIMVAPNTINGKLSYMERSGWIKCVRNRHGKAYSLTEKGQDKMGNMPSTAAEIHTFIKTILGS